MARSDVVPLILLILTIEICMKFFLGTSTPTTAIFDLFLNASQMADFSFMQWITSNMLNIAGLVGGGIAVGAFLLGGNNRLDFVVFGGLAVAFISYIFVFANLYGYLNSAFNQFSTIPMDGFFAMIIIIPLVTLYIFTMLKFWRGSD
jgi:hypothetical protein